VSRHGTGLAIVALLLVGGTALVGWAAPPASREITIRIHHSAFDPSELTVPAGVPVTFVLVNEDPIDHEWLIGDDGFHAAHRTGTHAVHGQLPTEVSIPALGTARTTIVFGEPGTYAYICHLPRHEAYGMIGVLTVVP
jgi:plastocyanin